jgi:hypothetical protein
MPIPNKTELTDVLLNAMHRIGRQASIEEQEAEVIRLLSISTANAIELNEGERSAFRDALALVRNGLEELDLLHSKDRGSWELTQRGSNVKSISELSVTDVSVLEALFDNSNGVEGLDKSSPEEFGQYPIESVLIRQETRTVFEIVRRIRDGRFIMDPDFQRDFIWKLEKQSKLIESMVMRIPLPVFYLAERDDGKTVVVDGLQRLTTFERFLDDDFALRDLQLAAELNGRKYSELPLKLQNRIEDTQLILYLIDSKVPEQARLDIFDRVNGGVPLTRQQMRNSIYCGEATRWLKREVESDEFTTATGRGLDWRTMRDRECVNRFCAFALLGVSAYSRGDMDAFLAQALKKMNDSSTEVLQHLSQRFRTSMKNNYHVFGPYSFRKHRSVDTRRSVINVALFDVFSVLLSRVSEESVNRTADQIHAKFFEMMDNAEFMDAISISTNATSKVQTRFEIAETELESILDVHTA